MRCPSCGTPMNKHAEKPVTLTSDEIILAVHTCPNCGKVESEELKGL
jgi:ribosomal protein S27AE